MKVSHVPNLNNYSKLYEYLAPIYSEPYTTWSTSSTITLQVRIPQIIPETSWNIRERDKIEYVSKIKGIPDILQSYRYKLQFASRGDAEIMGFSDWGYHEIIQKYSLVKMTIICNAF